MPRNRNRREKGKVGRFFDRIYGRAVNWANRFGKQTDAVLDQEEPIDFSAPSVPYYADLANRFNLVRVVSYMVLFVFVIVTVLSNRSLITYSNLYYLAKDIGAATLTAQSEADHFSYPTSMSRSDFALYRGGLVIAGGEEVNALSGSGRQTLTTNVAYANPCVRASDKYFLTFDRGEPGFSVYNPFVRVYAETTEFPVYDACVGHSGNFAVLTRSRDYKSEVRLYDNDMNLRATYHLKGYVTALTVSEEGDIFGIASAEQIDGEWQTKMAAIRLGKRVYEETTVFRHEFAASAQFIGDNRLAVLFRDHLYVLKNDLSVLAEYDFDGREPMFCAYGSGRVGLILKSGTQLDTTTLTVIDRNGKLIYEQPLHSGSDLSERITSMAFGGSRLCLLTQSHLYRFSGDGKTVDAVEVSRDTLAIRPTDDGEIFVCYPAYASRLDDRDFQKITD